MTEKTDTRSSHRDTMERVHRGERFAVTLPILGRVSIPRPEQLTFFTDLGALAALGIIDWPVALVIAAGQVLASEPHTRSPTGPQSPETASP
ncbi:hypothetical protein [Rhodococcus opacus]|uniref:hypothetical protein n=1 Tax=Rhodococcus opacus TaxID=37919 RepID=UPI00352F4138